MKRIEYSVGFTTSNCNVWIQFYDGGFLYVQDVYISLVFY